jgi:hypothetical protein
VHYSIFAHDKYKHLHQKPSIDPEYVVMIEFAGRQVVIVLHKSAARNLVVRIEGFQNLFLVHAIESQRGEIATEKLPGLPFQYLDVFRPGLVDVLGVAIRLVGGQPE